MQDDNNTEDLVAKYKAVLSELNQERDALSRTQEQLKEQLTTLEKQDQHNEVMLKAMETVILQMESYIDKYSGWYAPSACYSVANKGNAKRWRFSVGLGLDNK